MPSEGVAARIRVSDLGGMVQGGEVCGEVEFEDCGEWVVGGVGEEDGAGALIARGRRWEGLERRQCDWCWLGFKDCELESLSVS